MKKTLSCASAIAMAAALSSCGGPEEPAIDATVTVDDMNDMNDMNVAMAEGGPFANAEMKMDQGISGAVGINAADSWVRKMIAHHRGAVAMSRILLARNVTGHVADMAQQTIDKQSAEVAALQKLVATGNPDPASGALYRPAQVTMHDAMMAAHGSDIADTWVRKMLAHHKGAVAMSDIALVNGATGTVRAQIEQTRADQQKEIEHIEAMLSGRQPAGEPVAAPTPSPASQRTPAAKSATAKPAPSKPTTAPAEPKPAETAEPKVSDPTCLPEHRAAGHC
jgi:uncharacterized protein (DUF305 family)